MLAGYCKGPFTLVRFSASDGCERVDELCSHERTFIAHLLVHKHQKKKTAPEIAEREMENETGEQMNTLPTKLSSSKR
jgi:hypothetical protein